MKDMFNVELNKGDFVCHFRKVGGSVYKKFGRINDLTKSFVCYTDKAGSKARGIHYNCIKISEEVYNNCQESWL